jgi:hypothetical protein
VDSSGIDPLVFGAAAIFGAGVGGVAILIAGRTASAARRSSEHDAALIVLYAAAMSLDQTFRTWTELQPRTTNLLGRAVGHSRLVARLTGSSTRALVEWNVSSGERMWGAIGRALAVASPAEQPIVRALEAAFREWNMPGPAPAAWLPAIQALGEVLESRESAARARRRVRA